ncbi:MAG TPA: PAS domain-containing sensor histidine kinase [Nitrososphaera sp.]|jgi:PAS domain S-box-containing protein
MVQGMDGLIDSIPLLVCVAGPGGRIASANGYFAQATGFTKGELAGMSVFDLVSERKGTLKETLAACGSVKEVDVLVKKKDGTEFPGILAASRQGDSAIGIAITESSRLRQENDELRRKESLKDEFIAIASHELRTPIQPILGLALLAKKGAISSEEAWDSVLKEARRLTQLANDILDVSRIENGTLRYNFAKANVAEIVDYVVRTIKMGGLGREIDFSVSMDDAARAAQCDLDRQRITQVLTNVIGNAAKFTGKGRVAISARVDAKNSWYDIVVSDDGGGIPAAVLPHMFKKFMTRGVGEGEKHGSGLGLFISRAIVASHGGAIYLYNNEDRGATFVIRLPFERPGVLA